MALTNKLSAIGDAIREKTGKTELLTLDQMPVEIKAIETGGGDIEIEPIVLSGDCQYVGSGSLLQEVLNRNISITTNNITQISYMFYNTTVEEIPFEINCQSNLSSGTSLSQMFQGAKSLRQIPKINYANPSGFYYTFHSCQSLQEIPEDIYENWSWKYLENATSTYIQCHYGFYGCYSLRELPISLLKHFNFNVYSSYSLYNYCCHYCYALNEIKDFPVLNKSTWSSNSFAGTFQYCSRLKDLIFEVQEDNIPYTANWKNQTIDLSYYVGYVNYTNNITRYNSGLTTATQITDDATYQALKDNPDSWTIDINYSRYNHNSAVATINSLPDCSAYGTNTIKFKGASGALTDGGAINTLTEEEIAVATAKGWTVSLV